jgi:hypothetical protein
MMKTLNQTRDNSFKWSFGLHLSIALLGFLPIAHHMMQKQETEYLVELGYEDIPEVQSSGSEGLQAASPIYNEEPEPTMDQPDEQPIPVDAVEPVEQTTVAENNSEVISDVTTETESDVTASETSANGSDTETNADGGGNGSPIEGNQDGAATSGDGGAGRSKVTVLCQKSSTGKISPRLLRSMESRAQCMYCSVEEWSLCLMISKLRLILILSNASYSRINIDMRLIILPQHERTTHLHLQH